MTERIWTEEVPKPGSRAALGSAELEMVEVPDIWQITGNIAGFAAAHSAREIGLGGNLAPDGPALIRLGRDKALWRSGQSARLHAFAGSSSVKVRSAPISAMAAWFWRIVTPASFSRAKARDKVLGGTR